MKKAARKAKQQLKLRGKVETAQQSVYEQYCAMSGRSDLVKGKSFYAPKSKPLSIDSKATYTFYHGTDRDVARLIETPAMTSHQNGTAFHFGENADDVRTFGQLIIKVEVLGEHLIGLGIRTRVDNIFADISHKVFSPINEFLFSETAAKHIMVNGKVSVALSCNLKFKGVSV